MSTGAQMAAAAFVPPAAGLREFAARLAEKSQLTARAWATACANSADTDGHRLSSLLCDTVPNKDLATLVHRLQRRSVGLGDEWIDFCRARGLRHADPHQTDSRLLLQFVCWAIACAPARVVALKGPFDPVMEVAVDIAKDLLTLPREASDLVAQHSQPAQIAEELRTVLGIKCRGSREFPASTELCGTSQGHSFSIPNGRTQADATRTVDLKDDSTMSGSMASKSDRSESGASDYDEGLSLNRWNAQPASVRWLGPEPTENLNTTHETGKLEWSIPTTQFIYQ